MRTKIICWAASVLLAGAIGFLMGARGTGFTPRALISTAQAQERPEVPLRTVACATGLLQGSYVLTLEGIVPSSGEYYTTVGVMVFDGQGRLSLSNTQSINGRIIPPTQITGVYTLGETCGGRITLSTGSIFDIVINNTGREIHLIQVNGGNVISGVAKRL